MKTKHSVVSLATVAAVASWSLSGCAKVDEIRAGMFEEKVTVGQDGFSVTKDGITVSAGSGVADPGTEVTLRTYEESPYSSSIPSVLSVSGKTVEIVLGEGIQPDAPITITMEAPPEVLDGAVPIGITDAENGDLEPLEASYNSEDGTVTYQMEHLSKSQFAFLAPGVFSRFLSDLLLKFLKGEESSPPECLEEPVEWNGGTYVAHRMTDDLDGGNPVNAIWPCLRVQGDRLALELTSNSNRHWATITDPSATGHPGGTKIEEFVSYAVYKELFAERYNDADSLAPGTTMTYYFDPTGPPIDAEAMSDPAVMLAATSVYSISYLLTLPKRGIGAAQKAADNYDCAMDSIGVVGSVGEGFRGRFEAMFAAILTCMGNAASRPVQTLLSALNGVTGIVFGMVNNILDEVEGLWSDTPDNHGYIRISGGDESVSPNASRYASPYGYFFRTPTGYFRCGILPDYDHSPKSGAGCEGESPKSSLPECDRPADWYGPQLGIQVNRSGEVSNFCARGTVYGGGYGETEPVLQYGESITVWGFTCTSKESGPTCVHNETGHGFRISRESSGVF